MAGVASPHRTEERHGVEDALSALGCTQQRKSHHRELAGVGRLGAGPRAETELHPSAAQLLQRRGGDGDVRGVPRHRVHDERAERHPGGVRGNGGQHGPRVEDGTAAERDPGDVVVRPDRLETGGLGGAGGFDDDGRADVDGAEDDLGHSRGPWIIWG